MKKVVTQLFKAEQFKGAVPREFDMVVVKSNHRNYKIGDRCDYGDIQRLLSNGHTVSILPFNKLVKRP